MNPELKVVIGCCALVALGALGGLLSWIYNQGRAAGRSEGIGVGLRQAGLLPGTSYTVRGPDGERVIHLLGPGDRAGRPLLRAGQ